MFRNKIPIMGLCAVISLTGQTASIQEWQLPPSAAVKETGPRTYRFSVDYTSTDGQGKIVRRQRVTGDYTRGLPDSGVMWRNVSQADGDGPTAPLGAPQKRDFMEGFRYRDDLEGTMKPDFFKGFPASAVYERNLVWDTGMIELFGHAYFDRLKLNEPYHVASNQDVHMPDVGDFRNRDIVLEWIGRSRRNGRDCAIIQYEAFLNPLEIVNQGMTLKGRSDYWGEIWVSLETRQVEYGTLHEEVTGELTLGQNAPMNISVFRSGVLTPLNVN